MKELSSYLVLHGASYASLFGLYFSVLPLSEERTTAHWVMLVLAACLALYIVVRGAVRAWRGRSRLYIGTAKINAYMSRWVSKPGRTVILSRDMSWGSQYTAKSALLAKARAGDLTVLLHKATRLTDELKAAGAVVIEYASTGYEPKSRFTIIGFGKEGSNVAVGVTSGDEHRVVEFRAGADPIFAIADDLVRFVMGACRP